MRIRLQVPTTGPSPSQHQRLGGDHGNYNDASGFSHGFLRSPDGKFTSFDVPGAGGYGIDSNSDKSWRERS